MAKSKATEKIEKVSKEKKNYVRFKYTEEELVNAVNTIMRKEKSLNQVNKETGIPKSTLSNKVNNKVPIFRKMGPSAILSLNEEDVKMIEAPKLLDNSTTIYSCLEINKKRTESSSLNNTISS